MLCASSLTHEDGVERYLGEVTDYLLLFETVEAIGGEVLTYNPRVQKYSIEKRWFGLKYFKGVC